MLRAGTYRVQLSRHAGPDFQAREVLTQTRKLITSVEFYLLNLRPHLVSRISGHAPIGTHPQIEGSQHILIRPVKRPPAEVAFQSTNIPRAAVHIIPASGLGNHVLTSGCHLPILATMDQWKRGGAPDFGQVLKRRDL
jgi:hypothetical protein